MKLGESGTLGQRGDDAVMLISGLLGCLEHCENLGMAV